MLSHQRFLYLPRYYRKALFRQSEMRFSVIRRRQSLSNHPTFFDIRNEGKRTEFHPDSVGHVADNICRLHYNEIYHRGTVAASGQKAGKY